MINASGGWDTTALMDPKGTPDLNRLYTESQIQQVGSIPFAPSEGILNGEGLTNETFFSRYGSELLVINGIDISVNNHEPCTRYVGSGKLDSDRYPAFGALAASQLAPDAPLAFMALGAFGTTGGLIAKNTLTDFPSLLTLANADYTSEAANFAYMREETAAQIQAALAHSPSGLPVRDAAEAAVLDAQIGSRDLEWVLDHIPDNTPPDNLRRKIEVALTGFVSGACCAATIGFGQFDSHDNNDPDQMGLLPELLQGIDHLMVRAEQLGIRDRLVVVMQSEMGRTPWYNDNDGKDHWSIGSMMLMGAGITGNRVVGATGVDPETGFEQSPLTVNPATLALDPGGVRLRPEHIHGALRELAGVDESAAATEFDLGVPDVERLEGLFSG
ncbi:MAG: DUF1501 domain-containing protein [Nannocystaceae bacterium]|nr:DUF1501 domain-containing protein [Nannocystaceae bacterium]